MPQKWWDMISIPLSTVPFLLGVMAFLLWGRNTEPPLPIWIMLLVGVGAVLFILLSFLAFHRVRVERDKARVKESPIDAIVQELKSKIIYRKAYSDKVFSMLEIFDALRDHFALGLTYPQVHGVLRDKLDRDAVWGIYSSDILATLTTMGLIHSPTIDPSSSVFLDNKYTIPQYVYQLTDIGKLLAHKLMSQKPKIGKGGSQP